MDIKIITYSFLILCFIHVGKVKAQTCCSGGAPISGNIGLPSAESKSLQINLSYDVNRLNSLKFGTEKLEDDSRLRITNAILLEAGYTFSNSFSIDLLLSYVNQYRRIRFNSNDNITETFGIGDGIVLFKFKKQDLFKHNNELILALGPKLPLGSFNKKNEEGRTIIADLQPGSGAWDVFFWGHITQSLPQRPSSSVFTRFIYRYTGENNHYLGSKSYRFGNEFQIIAGWGDNIALFNKLVVNPAIGFRWRHADFDKIDGIKTNNTGGSFLYLTTSMGFNLSKNTILNLNAELPAYSKPFGIQLVPSFKFNIGIYKSFSFNNSINPKIQKL